MEKSKGERAAYHAYKDYANEHLGTTREETKISALWAPDFDYEFYSQYYGIKDPIDVLGNYLDDLQPYANVLKQAAALRQYHFTEFIENQTTEDADHQVYREGLNMVAKDAQEKWSYWHMQWTEKLDELVENHKAEISNIKAIASIEDPDSDNKASKGKSKFVRKRPKVSNREKQKRKRERRKQRKKAEKQALDAAISERTTQRDDVLKSYAWSGSLKVNKFFIEVSPTEMIEIIRRAKQGKPAYNMFNKALLFRVVNFGENDVETSLHFILYEIFSFITSEDDTVRNAVANAFIVFMFFNYDVMVNNLGLLLKFVVELGERQPKKAVDPLIGCFPSFNQYFQARRQLIKKRGDDVPYFEEMDAPWLIYRYKILATLLNVVFYEVLPKIDKDEFGTFIELYPQFKRFIQADPIADLPNKYRKYVVVVDDELTKLKRTLKKLKRDIRSVLPISSRISDSCEICGNFVLYQESETGVKVCSQYCSYINTFF